MASTGARQGVKISGNKGNKGKPWGHCKQTTFKTFKSSFLNTCAWNFVPALVVFLLHDTILRI